MTNKIPPVHGTPKECPVCGFSGRLDTEEADGPIAFDDSVWWNEKACVWECVECWLK